MIKLKQLIKESLKNMVFSKTIKPRHKKRLSKKITLFPQNPKLTMTPPPPNDSQKTKSEVHYLLAYNDGVIDNEMVQAYDDVVKSFMPVVEKNGVQVSADELQEILNIKDVYDFHEINSVSLSGIKLNDIYLLVHLWVRFALELLQLFYRRYLWYLKQMLLFCIFVLIL